MVAPLKQRILFWIGLLAITLLYCLYYFYFIYGLSREISQRAVHVVKFLFILLAYGAGTMGLRQRAAGWMMQIWHLLYAVALLLLVSLGIYDWGVARAPLALRGIADDLQEFLISPLLYVGIAILNRSLDQRKG